MAHIMNCIESSGIRIRIYTGDKEEVEIWKKAGWSRMSKEEFQTVLDLCKAALGGPTLPEASKPVLANSGALPDSSNLPSADDLAKRTATSTTEPRRLTVEQVKARELTVEDIGQGNSAWGPQKVVVQFPMQ